MAKIITFSRHFQKCHPKAGEPTFFAEKLMACLADELSGYSIPNEFKDWDWYEYYNCERFKKRHTIREGTRFKEGDEFSPRVWSGAPYRSKQIQIAPNLKIVKVYSFEIIKNEYLLNGQALNLKQLTELAANDGLTSEDFECWFNCNEFTGQVICWSDKINYN